MSVTQRVIWKDEVDSIKEKLAASMTLGEVGDSYGVSRQRMYQVLSKFGIETAERKRDKLLDGLDDPKYYWLNKALVRVGIPKAERPTLLTEIELPTHCPCLGIELNYLGGSVGDHSHTPSIDKLIPSKGYIKGNMNVISHRANIIKYNASLEELIKITEWVRFSLTS